MIQKILRLPSVELATGLPRSTIYLRMTEKTFPKNIKLGKRSVGWLESDINKWIDQKAQQTKNKGV